MQYRTPLSSRSRSPERVSFANIDEALPLPDLIAIQRDSFQWFLDKGLAEAFTTSVRSRTSPVS
jgi:DNA-directed RNA polymerase subunit beta